MPRLLVVLLAPLLLMFLVLGPTKLLFRLWPTTCGDRAVPVSPDVLDALRALLAARKFEQDSISFYPGAMSEASRLEAQEHVDRLLRRLISSLPEHGSKSFVLGAMKESLDAFTTIESEERDRMLRYLEEILGILRIESSGQLFNVWRYGVPDLWRRSA